MWLFTAINFLQDVLLPHLIHFLCFHFHPSQNILLDLLWFLLRPLDCLSLQLFKFHFLLHFSLVLSLMPSCTPLWHFSLCKCIEVCSVAERKLFLRKQSVCMRGMCNVVDGSAEIPLILAASFFIKYSSPCFTLLIRFQSSKKRCFFSFFATWRVALVEEPILRAPYYATFTISCPLLMFFILGYILQSNSLPFSGFFFIFFLDYMSAMMHLYDFWFLHT